jgi:hypothetical protein
MEDDFICPEELVCIDEETWGLMVEEYDLSWDEPEMVALESTSDVQAIVDLSWELLFLTPWELIYIGLPMSVLAFYGLSIYAIYKWIQKRFS